MVHHNKALFNIQFIKIESFEFMSLTNLSVDRIIIHQIFQKTSDKFTMPVKVWNTLILPQML